MRKLKTGTMVLLALMVTIIIGLPMVQAAVVEEIQMCYDYSSQLSPLGTSSTFLTTNKEAGVYTRIRDPPSSVVYKFFYREGGVLTEYAGGYQLVNVIDKVGDDWGIAYAKLNINGFTPSFKPGVWTVKVYIDGEHTASKEFSIVDYPALASSISSIQDTVEGIVEEKNQVLEDYDAMEAEYNQLIQDYADLEDATVSQAQLDDIQDDYDALNTDYLDLKKAQTNTKMMMYAAIVVALVAIVVAVYFGVMKQ